MICHCCWLLFKISLDIQLAAISSKDVISALKLCFSEFGIPEEVISDNGHNSQPGSTKILQLSMGSGWPQAVHTTQRAMVLMKGSSNHQNSSKEVCQRWFWPLFWLIAPEVNPTWQKDPGELLQTGSWEQPYLSLSGLQPIVKLSEQHYNKGRFTPAMMPMPKS